MSNTPRTDRSARRAFSRDAARQFTRPGGNTATVPDVAAVVHARHPMPHRIVTPKSGKLRINTKRNTRATFWAEERRTVAVRVSAEMEPYFRQHLGLLGNRVRIDGSTPLDWGMSFDLAVHIPGAPAAAVRATPTYRSVRHGNYFEPELDGVDWFDANGQHIHPKAEALLADAREALLSPNAHRAQLDLPPLAAR